MESDITPTKVLRVIVAEDHELARNGLIYSLQKKGQVEVVGAAENGELAVELVKKHTPDIVLMDIGMPILDGISATQRIKQQYPEVKVIILTSLKEGDLVYASLAARADAYCMKDIKTERLLQVLEMVRDGAIWLDPAIARMVMSALPITLPQKSSISRERYNVELTEREREVLSFIVDGLSNKEIAEALSVTVNTVKAHVGNIIQKLAVDDRTQAAVKALRDGLIQKSGNY